MMFSRVKRHLCAFIAGAALLPAAAQAAPADTTYGYITFMYGGWTIAYLRVQTDFAFTNPQGCSLTDGYIVDPADAGSTLFSSMLLSAYMAHRKVSFTIDGCAGAGRPHIIAVAVSPS